MFLQDLEEGLIGGTISERVDQLGFYPLEPITFEEEFHFIGQDLYYLVKEFEDLRLMVIL